MWDLENAHVIARRPGDQGRRVVVLPLWCIEHPRMLMIEPTPNRRLVMAGRGISQEWSSFSFLDQDTLYLLPDVVGQAQH